MLNNLLSLVRDEEGATAVEYSLIAAVLAGLIVIAFGILGGGFETVLTNIRDAMLTAAP